MSTRIERIRNGRATALALRLGLILGLGVLVYPACAHAVEVWSTDEEFTYGFLIPPIALVIPLYLIMARLQLLNTRLGLIIVYCTFTTPFVIWIMGNFFRTIPHELEDAARVDGCTRVGALFRVILPLARPGLLATMPDAA